MFKFIYPQKDSFISNHPDMLNRNFGIDEVLEIESRRILDDVTSGYVPIYSRGLLKFDIQELSSSIASNNISNPKFFLELFTVEAVDTPREYTVFVNPVSQSWEVGQGRLYDGRSTDGVSWIYRNGSEDLWSGSLSASLAEASLSLSQSVSFTDTFLKDQGGGTWYDSYTSSSIGVSTASIDITSIQDGDSFILAQQSGSSFEFQTTNSIHIQQLGYASCSVEIGFIDSFDRFTISASKQANITVIPDNDLNGCADEFYIGWISSSTIPTESHVSIQFTNETLYPGKEFELYDCWNDVTWSLRATNNPDIVDINECNTKFFVSTEVTSQSVANLADEINSIENLYLTASVSQSFATPENDVFLVLDSVDMGMAGNCFYLWDTDDTSESSSYSPCAELVRLDDVWGGRVVRGLGYGIPRTGLWTTEEEQELLEKFKTTTTLKNINFLEGGLGIGNRQRFDYFIDKLTEISGSYGFGFDVDGYTINFVSEEVGVIGNDYYFSSGSNHTQSFNGGYTSSSISQPEDIPSQNIYFFETGSTVIESVENLANKINSVLDFVNGNILPIYLTYLDSVITYQDDIVVTDGGSLQFTSSLNGDEGITFTSGSTSITLGGSDINTLKSLEATQKFNFESSDINVDVTDIVNSWLIGDIPNEGFIIRNSGEGSSVDYGKLRFYSQNTNTIYIPRLTVKWDNQLYDTSLDLVDIEDAVVYIKNLKESYKYNEIVKLRLLAREKYPPKTFSNVGSRYVTTKALPENTTFAVQDAESEEYLIPFDDYNKLSCDDSGPFFILDMNSLPQERYFRLLFKSTKNSVTSIFKDKGIFKVTR